MRAFVIGSLILLSGCSARTGVTETFEKDESEYVVTILLDMSGSFQHMMTEGGKAYDFALQVSDRYFRDRLGTRDRIIIAQASDQQRFLLWEGTPLELRKEFPTPEAFARFLKMKSSPYSSPIHEAMNRVVKYMISKPSVARGTAKPVVFVLSDMIDPNTASLDELKQNLRTFSECDGVMALFYVDQDLVAEWNIILSEAHIREAYVESEIVGKPNLPNFD
jgi:hypothetical protein